MPPSDLARRTPDLVSVPAGTVIHRFYTAVYEPVLFDTSTGGRLNAPDASYGVLYAARDESGAFAETFLRVPGRTLIDTGMLGRKAYVKLDVVADLRLIKLAGPGLARLGATAEIAHAGLPYDAPQAWSKALWQHPLRPDGIAYYARHDDEALCYAVFDRAVASVREAERQIDLDQDWFWRLANRYGVGLAP